MKRALGIIGTLCLLIGFAGWQINNPSAAGGLGDALVANPLSQFAATTSLQLKGVLSDETGSGAAVFATSPALVTPDLGTPTALVLTSATGLPLTSGVTGSLPVANGGDKGAVLQAYCTGTVGTASATEYNMSPFNPTGTNCTVTALGAEMPIPYACSATHLTVKAGTAGAVGGSGVIKVYKNGSATSNLTCTLGTGTTCTDASTTMAYAINDTYKITVTTGQATDATANVRASFQCQ